MPSPHLERKLKEALGEDAGAELAAVTDRIDPVRADIAELRHLMATMMERSAKEQMRYLFVAWATNFVAIIGLYATVIALTR
jgi:RNase adaptor protein for sRNA GlmZ degradation